MSIANEQQFAMDQLGETNDGSKNDKDVCKKMPNLPTEFHESLLLDSEDPSPERPRNSGDFSSHGLRRNDYSSSPPTKGEFGSNSRGIHGRWEGHTGFGAGPRPQSNDSYQLRRSNEPYHPPRPYKAPPFTRRDARDSFNDETFDFSNSTNEDRAEEERKRELLLSC